MSSAKTGGRDSLQDDAAASCIHLRAVSDPVAGSRATTVAVRDAFALQLSRP